MHINRASYVLTRPSHGAPRFYLTAKERISVECDDVSNVTVYARQVDTFSAVIDGKTEFLCREKRAGKTRSF
jgi:hypothetical protein